MPQTTRRSLGQILTSYGIISQAQLEEALRTQKQNGLRLGETLEALGYCTIEDVEWALSAQFDLPLVRLTQDSIDPQAARLVPPGLARAGTLIPIWAVGEDIGVVMADPTNQQVVNAVIEATGKQVQFSLGLPSEIRKAIDQVFGSVDAGDTTFVAGAFGMYDSKLFSDIEKQSINLDPTGGVFLQHLFAKAVEVQARTIYFEQRDKRYNIRIRSGIGKHGTIVCHRDWYNQLIDKLEVLCNARPFGMLGVKRGRYIIDDEPNGDRWGYEVISAEASGQRTVTCRPFLRRAASPDIMEIDFGGNVAILADALHAQNSGIIIADLPNMSSVWLLRAILFALSDPEHSVAVLGDPAQIAQERIEDRNYKLFNIAMFANTDLAVAYRELHELAPDVLILQNPKNQNPLPMLEEARLAGHKLVTTFRGTSALDLALNLHAEDAKGFQTSENLVVTAGLPVNILCEHCKAAVNMQVTARARYGIADQTKLYKAVGCSECHMTGMQRIDFIGEVLLLNSEVKQSLDTPDPFSALQASGWEPLANRLVRLLNGGQIAVAEFVRLMRNIG